MQSDFLIGLFLLLASVNVSDKLLQVALGIKKTKRKHYKLNEVEFAVGYLLIAYLYESIASCLKSIFLSEIQISVCLLFLFLIMVTWGRPTLTLCSPFFEKSTQAYKY